MSCQKVRNKRRLTRREFLKSAGVVVATVAVGTTVACETEEPAAVVSTEPMATPPSPTDTLEPEPTATPQPTPTPTPTNTSHPTPTITPEPTEEIEEEKEVEVEATYDVIVVGAGIAGLTAAYYLQDYDVKVLERGDGVGGRVISGTYQGFSYAKGTEYLGKPRGILAQMIRDLNVQPKEIPAPMDAHFHDGKFYYGEEGIALMHIEQSSLAEYNRFVSTMQEYYGKYDETHGFDTESELAELDDITAREWFGQHKFPASFYGAYNVTFKGLFGATIDEVSALSVIPEIVFDFEGAKAIPSVEELENTPNPEGGASGSYSFMTGITEITDAIARYLGDKVQVNSPVTAVTQGDDEYLVTYTDKNGHTHILAADVVILATPAPVALRIASEVLSEEQEEIMEQVPYAVYVTAALFSEEPIFNQAFDLAVPDGYFFTDVYDSTWVQRHYDLALKDKRAFVTGVYVAPESYEDRGLLDMPDDDILENVYEDLAEIFPGVEDKVVGYDIQRFPYAYPIMTLGAYKRLAELHEITEGNLLLAGDYMIYPTFEAASQSGYLAAQKARDELS